MLLEYVRNLETGDYILLLWQVLMLAGLVVFIVRKWKEPERVIEAHLERDETLGPAVSQFTSAVARIGNQLGEVQSFTVGAFDRLTTRMGKLDVRYGPTYRDVELTNDSLCPRYDSRCKETRCLAWLPDGKCNDLMLNFTNKGVNNESV